MSDTNGKYTRNGKGDLILCPEWLYGMPDEFWEAYFDVCQTCAVATRWGFA